MTESIDSKPPIVIATVGGPVDEARVSLAVYSDDLQPETITSLLSCSPSRSHRRGERKRAGSVPFPTGAWILTEEGGPHESVDPIIRRLLMRLPDDDRVWLQLARDHELQVRFGVHMSGWNRGFSISTDALARLSRMQVSLEFDLYAYGDDDTDE
ncbi:MAG TPA: DUF4279 domain-containing protein [Polyangiaceae bacterium]|nr:DUF4279 domain-containing protein [Polyangiaceae bacterium]